MTLELLKNSARKLRRIWLSAGLNRCSDHSQSPREIEATAEFSIIVAIHDSPEVTARCLKSLQLYTPQAQVILVDDGSRAVPTKELIARYVAEQGWMHVVHDQPQGHSRACESGANQADRPILCFLNSDTFVTPWGWDAIRSTFRDRQDVAVVGPSTSWATTEQRIIAAMHCRNEWSDNQIVEYARRYIARSQQRDCLVELPEISGFAFFIRKGLWVEYGGFDPNIMDYGNEAELCIRLRLSGWRLMWNKCAYIHHFGSRSYARISDDFINERKRSIGRYIAEKHGLSIKKSN